MENLTQAEHIKEMLEEIDINSFNQSLIKDNKIIFILEEKTYRCIMPSQKDFAMAEDLENRLKVEYLQKKGYVTRNKLKQILKDNQGIDIDKLENDKEECQKELKDVYLELAITQTQEDEELKRLKDKKGLIEQKFTDIIIEITEHMKSSIEEQVRKKYYEYLTHLCTEKYGKKGDWLKVWDGLDEYQQDNSKLAHNAVAYLQTLILNVRS